MRHFLFTKIFKWKSTFYYFQLLYLRNCDFSEFRDYQFNSCHFSDDFNMSQQIMNIDWWIKVANKLVWQKYAIVKGIKRWWYNQHNDTSNEIISNTLNCEMKEIRSNANWKMPTSLCFSTFAETKYFITKSSIYFNGNRNERFY